MGFACWQLREPIPSGVAFRYNAVALVALSVTMALIIGMFVLYLVVDPIIRVFTDWYVRTYP